MHQHLTILFADLADSTRLYQTEGDEVAHRLVTDSLQRMREEIEAQQGTLLRTIGDAVLASFDSADHAFHAAIGIQRSHQECRLSVRVGFHHGEVIPDDGDIYGNAVNLAARVASYANAEEIFTTVDTLERLSVALRARTEFLDRVDFKGVQEPMGVYRVAWLAGDEQTVIRSTRSSTSRVENTFVLDLRRGARRLRVDPSHPVLRIGRSIDCDVIVDNDSISRHHARIEFLRGRYVLKDSSTNGTFVERGGRPVDFVRREEYVLNHFGLIGFGRRPEERRNDTMAYRMIVSGD